MVKKVEITHIRAKNIFVLIPMNAIVSFLLLIYISLWIHINAPAKRAIRSSINMLLKSIILLVIKYLLSDIIIMLSYFL